MKTKLALKKAIVEKCLSLKKEELAILQESQRLQLENASTDDIDQYDVVESPRESMMQAIEEIAPALDFLSDQINILQNILSSLSTKGLHDRVSLGTVVHTTTGNFLIAVAQEPFQFDDTTYQGVSVESPLYQQLKGLQKGGIFDKKSVILDVF